MIADGTNEEDFRREGYKGVLSITGEERLKRGIQR